MSVAKLKKVGGSTAIFLPPALLRHLNLRDGSDVSVEAVNGRIVIAPHRMTRGRIGFSARMAMCDFSKPPSKARQAEDEQWLNQPCVGREAEL